MVKTIDEYMKLIKTWKENKDTMFTCIINWKEGTTKILHTKKGLSSNLYDHRNAYAR